MKAPRINEMTQLRIAGDELAQIRNGRGALLRVQHGAVWVTQSRSSEDVVLEAGDAFRLDRKGMTVISACGRASHALLTLTPTTAATPTSLAMRVRRLLIGPAHPSIGGTAVAGSPTPTRPSSGAAPVAPITNRDETGALPSAPLDSNPGGRADPAGLTTSAGTASVSCAPAT